MEQLEFTAAAGDTGRLDAWLAAQCPALSRSALQNLIEQGCVTKNAAPVNKKEKVVPGAVYTVELPDPQPIEAQPQNIPLDIVYEDDDLLVVNKPKGMVVHPAPGNYENTLVNALMYHCKDSLSGINGVLRPGIVHRIDKNTSGLLIVAKNDFAHKGLAEQIKEHSFTREYRAVCIGHLKQDEGTVVAPIGRSTNDRKKMTVTDKNSKNAVTHYKVLEQLNGYDYLRLRLETGRTHQIRVHMAYLGHPLAGDDVYGKPRNAAEQKLCGQCLHAGLIGFIHPRSGEYVEFSSELPEYFTRFMKGL